MLQLNNILALIITTFILWSWCTLYCVISDPQTNLVSKECSPRSLLVSNFSIINDSINTTFRDIREMIVTEKKYFVVAQQGNEVNPAYSLFQCRNYLSVHDCVSCYDVAALQIRNNNTVAGCHAVYDGCFLRYNSSTTSTLHSLT